VADDPEVQDLRTTIETLKFDIDQFKEDFVSHIRGINPAIDVDAHAASSVIVVATSSITSTNVQGALEEIQSDVDGIISGTGQANTYSNAGTAGVGIVLTKAGVDLPFKSIAAGNSGVSITDDTATNSVDISILTSGIDHADLGSIGTNSHGVIDTHLANSDVHFELSSITTLGDVAFTGDISVSGTADLGSLNVSGNTILGGTLSVSNATTLNSAVTINSTLVVSGSTTLSDLIVTGDLSVSGTADIGTLVVSGVTNLQGATTISGALVVNASATFSAVTITTLNVSASAVIGSLVVSGSSQFNGSILVSGATVLGATLQVSGTSTFNSKLTVNSDLSVSGTGTFGTLQATTLHITGSTTLNNLVVSGCATFNDEVTFNSAVTINAAVTIESAVSINSDLTVSGTTTLGVMEVNNSANFLASINVCGLATLGNLVVSGTSTFNDQVTINGAVTINSNTVINGDLTVSGAIIAGSFTFPTAINFSDINASGTTTLNTLVVSGTSCFNSPARFKSTVTTSALFVNDTALFACGVNINCNLSVSGTGTFDSVHVTHSATAANDHAISVDCDAKGFGDIKALEINYVTGGISAGDTTTVILVSIDQTTAGSASVAAMEVLATDGVADVHGMIIGAGVAVLEQHVGAFANASTIEVNGTATTAALSIGGAGNIPIFTLDNDTVLIGSSATFEEIQFIFETPASAPGVAPTFEFSTTGSSFAFFTPTDGTDGMRTNGVVAYSTENIPTWGLNTASEFAIRVVRTRNSVTTTPVVDLINIAATEDFEWDSSGNIIARSLLVDHIHAPLTIDHSATAAGEHSLEMDVHVNGFGDVKAIDVDYITGAIISGSDEAIILVNIDEEEAVGGTVIALEVLATDGTATIQAVFAGAGVQPIEQQAGSFGNATTIEVNGTATTAALSIGGSGSIPVFTADNDTIVVGFTSIFEEMEFIFETVANQTIQPTFEHSVTGSSFTVFTPVDGTNGCRNNGVIAWEDADIPTWGVGTASEFLIRVTRTRNNLGTTPVMNRIEIAATTEFTWDCSGNLHVNDISAAGDLTVAGTATVGTLVVSGVTNLQGATTVSGALTVNAAAAFNSGVSVNETLIVSGLSTLNSAVINGGLVVSGTTNLQGATTISGATVINSTFTVNSAAIINSTLNVSGATTLRSTLQVDGATTINAALVVSGTTNLQGTTTVSGAFVVNAVSTFNSGVTINGDVVISGSLTVAGINIVSHISDTGIHFAISSIPASTDIATVIKTADYVATTADDFIRFDTSASNLTLTLFSAAGNSGAVLYVKKVSVDTNAVTIDGDGTNTIDDELNYVLRGQFEAVMIVCDGANWHTMGIRAQLSEVSLYDGNGRGSDSGSRRYSTVFKNVTNGHMTLTQSSTAGDSVTINVAGLYFVLQTDWRSSSQDMGIAVTINETTNINPADSGVTAAQIWTRTVLAGGTTIVTCSGLRFLQPGDIVKPKVNTVTGVATDTRAHFECVKVA